MSTINLKEFMQAIRRELQQAQEEMDAKKEEPLFALQELAVELKVVLSETKSKDGGFNITVLSGKGAKSAHSETVQTVRLTYKVIPAEGSTRRVGDRFHPSGKKQQEDPGIEVLRGGTR